MSYKKLSEFTNKEVKNLAITLISELEVLTKDEELMAVCKELFDLKESTATQKMNMTVIELIPALVNNLLIRNENALWRILSAITLKTPDEAQDMNNLETISVLQDFFSIAQYKALFTRAIKSGIKK